MEALMGLGYIAPQRAYFTPPLHASRMASELGIEPQLAYEIRTPPIYHPTDIPLRLSGALLASYGLGKLSGYGTEQLREQYLRWKYPHWEFMPDFEDIWFPLEKGYEALYPEEFWDEFLKYGTTYDEPLGAMVQRYAGAGAAEYPPELLLGDVVTPLRYYDPRAPEFFRLSRLPYGTVPVSTRDPSLLASALLLSNIPVGELTPEEIRNIFDWTRFMPSQYPTPGEVVEPITFEGTVPTPIPIETTYPEYLEPPSPADVPEIGETVVPTHVPPYVQPPLQPPSPPTVQWRTRITGTPAQVGKKIPIRPPGEPYKERPLRTVVRPSLEGLKPFTVRYKDDEGRIVEEIPVVARSKFEAHDIVDSQAPEWIRGQFEVEVQELFSEDVE